MARILARLLATGDEDAHPWRESLVAGMLGGIVVGWQEHSVVFGIVIVPILALAVRATIWTYKRGYQGAIPSVPWLPPPVPRAPDEEPRDQESDRADR